MTTVPTPDDLLPMVGVDLGTTEWVELTRQRVDEFVDATATGAGSAAPTTTGACPDEVDGFLILSIVNLFLPDLLTVEHFSMGVNVGLEQVRFPAGAPVGARVRARGDVVGVSEERGGVQVTVRITVERDLGSGRADDEPACVADTVSRFFP